MKSVSDLRFGSIDAQDYLNNPDGPLSEFFKKSFYKSIHLERAIHPDVYFLLGEKGTGKSAYAVYASHHMKPGFLADTVFFNRNDFTRFIEVASSLGVQTSQFSSLWVFVFSVLLIDRLQESSDLPMNAELDNFMNAVHRVTLGARVKSISQSIEIADQVSSVFRHYAAVAKLELSASDIDLAKPIFKINRLTDICINALTKLPDIRQFAIFLDGLDVRPDGVSYGDYLSVVSSVCNAVWDTNSKQLTGMSHQLKMVLLLRPDILETVPIQNRGPKLMNHSHLVEWSTRYVHFQESEIFKFTDRVLSSQQSQDERLAEGDAWRKYFPFRISSRVSKTGDDPFILFLRHSFYKPRDIVHYLTLMRDYYKNTGRGDSTSFEEDVFKNLNIRKEHSDYIMLEIRDQLSFYYTDEEYQQFLDFANGFLGKHIDKRNRVVGYDDFCIAHADYLQYNERNNKTTVPSFSTADITLQFMFDLNVIGYYEEKTLRSGEKRVFTNYSFRQRSFANLRPKVPTGSRYVMHYGVAKSLLVDFH